MWQTDKSQRQTQQLMEKDDSDIEHEIYMNYWHEPKLVCSKTQPIQRICVNPLCKFPSLICNELDCQICGKSRHVKCYSYPLTGAHEHLNRRINHHKEFVQRVSETQAPLIFKINDTRQKLLEKYKFGNLQDKYCEIIEQIYASKNNNCLAGKQSKEFCERIEKQDCNSQEYMFKILQEYKKKSEKLIQTLIVQRQKIFELFFGFDKMQESIKNSKILDCLKQEQLEFLKESLLRPKQLNLLFRGSQHNFSAAAFHKFCDGITQTLTVVKTEAGKVVAGYNKYRWNQVKDGYFGCPQKQTFLLSLDMKVKLVPKDGIQLIYCHSDFGPVFGCSSAWDLFIKDNCFNIKSSGGEFVRFYNKESGEKFDNSQDTITLFSGATGGFNFRVAEYEVFKVIK